MHGSATDVFAMAIGGVAFLGIRLLLPEIPWGIAFILASIAGMFAAVVFAAREVSKAIAEIEKYNLDTSDIVELIKKIQEEQYEPFDR